MRIVTSALLATAAAAAWALNATAGPATSYFVDDSRGPSRTFDGVGGLSGGGATSVFIRDYPEPMRSTVLDLLFKPNYGASLHILKVRGAARRGGAAGEALSELPSLLTARFPPVPARARAGGDWRRRSEYGRQ